PPPRPWRHLRRPRGWRADPVRRACHRARRGRRGEEPARASKRGRGIPPGVRGSRAWPPHGTSGRCHLAEAIIVKSESEPHPSTGQPIGRPVDATPARRPGPVTLEGRYGRVEKLDVRHAANLWKTHAGHDHIWTYLSAYRPFSDAPAFSDWLASRVVFEDPYSYAIVGTSGHALGIAALMEIRPAMRVIEVGHVVYSPALIRTPHGFVYEGTFRQHMIAKGRNRDDAWFAILASEWPAQKAPSSAGSRRKLSTRKDGRRLAGI